MVGEGKQTMKAVAQPLGFCLGTLCCPFVQYLQSLALSASRVTMIGFGVLNLSMHGVLGDLIFCLQVTQSKVPCSRAEPGGIHGNFKARLNPCNKYLPSVYDSPNT